MATVSQVDRVGRWFRGTRFDHLISEEVEALEGWVRTACGLVSPVGATGAWPRRTCPKCQEKAPVEKYEKCARDGCEKRAKKNGTWCSMECYRRARSEAAHKKCEREGCGGRTKCGGRKYCSVECMKKDRWGK